MNRRELSELRRRFQPEKTFISHIYGCYVNSNKEIIAYLDEPLGVVRQEEAEKYLSLLKKSLSGALGRNLLDVSFTTGQVAEGEEHRLLSDLRDTDLKDEALRQQFFQKAVESLNMGDTNYLILLAHDVYDVPYRAKDDSVMADASDHVFSYLVCSVCPVKDGKVELSYDPQEKQFHNRGTGQIVSQPELGFLFPAFDDRATNLYNALFYTRKPDELHQEFIDGIFHTEPIMSAGEQKETFSSILYDAMEGECRFDVLQSLHEQLRERIELHKESKDPEPLGITAREVGGMLNECGVAEKQIETFQTKCEEQFGDDVVLRPENIIDSKKFKVSTADSQILVSPDRSYLVETRFIDGKKYILIPADETVEVNGLPVTISQ